MVKKIPDVTAYRLEEAVNILKENGISFSLKKTTSIFFREKHTQYEVSSRQCRVLKQVEYDSMLVLIFAEEAC